MPSGVGRRDIRLGCSIEAVIRHVNGAVPRPVGSADANSAGAVQDLSTDKAALEDVAAQKQGAVAIGQLLKVCTQGSGLRPHRDWPHRDWPHRGVPTGCRKFCRRDGTYKNAPRRYSQQEGGHFTFMMTFDLFELSELSGFNKLLPVIYSNRFKFGQNNRKTSCGEKLSHCQRDSAAKKHTLPLNGTSSSLCYLLFFKCVIYCTVLTPMACA